MHANGSRITNLSSKLDKVDMSAKATVHSAFDLSYTTWLIIICTASNQYLQVHSACYLHIIRDRNRERRKGGMERERDREDLLISVMVLTGLCVLSVWELSKSHRHRKTKESHKKNKTVGAPAMLRMRAMCGKRHPLQVASLPPLPAYI